MASVTQQPTTEQELQQIFSSSTYVIVDFYADWCGPCRTIAPVFEGHARTHTIPGVLTFVKANVDKLNSFAAQYNISSIPAFMFFKDGKQVAANGEKMVQNVVGLKNAVEKISGLAQKRVAANASTAKS